MEDQNIVKLLSSHNKEDVLVGWELAKIKNIPNDSEDWFPYFDAIHFSVDKDPLEVSQLKSSLIREIAGTEYFNNKLWIGWGIHLKDLKNKNRL